MSSSALPFREVVKVRGLRSSAQETALATPKPIPLEDMHLSLKKSTNYVLTTVFLCLSRSKSPELSDLFLMNPLGRKKKKKKTAQDRSIFGFSVFFNSLLDVLDIYNTVTKCHSQEILSPFVVNMQI